MEAQGPWAPKGLTDQDHSMMYRKIVRTILRWSDNWSSCISGRDQPAVPEERLLQSSHSGRRARPDLSFSVGLSSSGTAERGEFSLACETGNCSDGGPIRHDINENFLMPRLLAPPDDGDLFDHQPGRLIHQTHGKSFSSEGARGL